jgi:hypothetical protein
MSHKKDGSRKALNISRRKFFTMSAASSVAAGLTVPLIGNAFVSDGLRRNCWDAILDDKTSKDNGLDPLDVSEEVDQAFPKLNIIPYKANWPYEGPNWFGTPRLGECFTTGVIVENLGMTVATTVFVEMLESNRMASSFEAMAFNPVDLKTECFRRDLRGPFVIYPGRYISVPITFKREFQDQGQAVCICYDTIRDPRKFPLGVGIGVPKNRKLACSGAFSTDDFHACYYTDGEEGICGHTC